MLKVKTQVTVKLCAIAACVDGIASSEERWAIFEKIAEQYDEDLAEVNNYIKNQFDYYQSEGLEKERDKALSLSITALQELGIDSNDPSDAQAAFALANEVMWADGDKSLDERRFLEDLYDEVNKFADLGG